MAWRSSISPTSACSSCAARAASAITRRKRSRSRTSTPALRYSCASSKTSDPSTRGPEMNAQAAPQAGPYEDLGRWIDAHHPEQIEFLREIVKVPSDTPPGDNAPAAEKAAALLTAMSFAVERHPVPDDFLRAYGMRSVTNLIVRQRFGSGGPTVALNAHGDVVPPGEGWTRPPYGGVIEDGRMYGRGVGGSDRES